MLLRTRAKVMGSAVAAIGLVAGSVVATQPAVAAGTRTITVHVTSSAINFSTGDTVAPGFATFQVEARHGEHTLQLLRLTDGYTFRQARRDIGKAFEGDKRAIRHVDRRLLWLGGAVATPERTGRFAETLYTGDYVVLDQDHDAVTRLHVTGGAVDGGSVSASTVVTAANGRRDNVFRVSESALPHAGWTLFRDRTAEPHFMILQQVARSTTRNEVRKFLASGSNGNPPWIRSAFTSTGVISPDTQMYFHYRLPRGRYLMICFWPSIDTGMPHAVMGMYKLVDLR